MKLKDLQLSEWTGAYKVIVELENICVLILELKLEGWSEEGRRNLIAIDKDENIIWIAEPPSEGYQLGWFRNFRFEYNKLEGWYGGSTKVEIDIKTGQIVSQKFVW
jgi:hypothetical protein